MDRSTAATICAALAVIFTAVVAPANAATPNQQAVTGGSDPAATRQVVIPFNAGTTLKQAAVIAAKQSDGVVGFRIDNGNVVGEYYSSSGQSAAEYLAGFRALYGTDPRVVGLVTQRPKVGDASRAPAPAPPEPTISTRLPDFQPPAVSAVRKAALSAVPAAAPDNGAQPASAASVGSGWMPQNVYSKTTRSGAHQYFTMKVNWNGATSPANIDPRFGMEAGIDLYNDATGTRGVICGPDYRDQFIAKNYNWYSWSSFSPNGTLAPVNAYADYNDLFDSCGRNSMAVGFATPQNFADDGFGYYEVTTQIDAPIGVTTSSRLGGDVSTVNNTQCFPGISYTDCMGTANLPGETRSTLDKGRAWVANPNKCWGSGDYGTSVPNVVTCPA